MQVLFSLLGLGAQAVQVLEGAHLPPHGAHLVVQAAQLLGDLVVQRVDLLHLLQALLLLLPQPRHGHLRGLQLLLLEAGLVLHLVQLVRAGHVALRAQAPADVLQQPHDGVLGVLDAADDLRLGLVELGDELGHLLVALAEALVLGLGAVRALLGRQVRAQVAQLPPQPPDLLAQGAGLLVELGRPAVVLLHPGQHLLVRLARVHRRQLLLLQQPLAVAAQAVQPALEVLVPVVVPPLAQLGLRLGRAPQRLVQRLLLLVRPRLQLVRAVEQRLVLAELGRLEPVELLLVGAVDALHLFLGLARGPVAPLLPQEHLVHLLRVAAVLGGELLLVGLDLRRVRVHAHLVHGQVVVRQRALEVADLLQQLLVLALQPRVLGRVRLVLVDLALQLGDLRGDLGELGPENPNVIGRILHLAAGPLAGGLHAAHALLGDGPVRDVHGGLHAHAHGRHIARAGRHARAQPCSSKHPSLACCSPHASSGDPLGSARHHHSRTSTHWPTHC
mmetsp:Transcript_30741/g.48379  ORF Transcript_30741/g.48379 Transcript_30741/m.48379 type:complete len:502 (-) Transcript_30741:141-1646(-)